MTEAEWLACKDPQEMLEAVSGTATDRKRRLFGVACCRRIWRLLPDRKCRAAVERAEAFVDGFCSREQLQAASTSVAVGMLALRGECAEYAATAASCVSGRADVERTAEAAAVAHGIKISLDDWAEEKRTEQVQQAILLRDIFDNPFRPITFAPEWRTDTAKLLAARMYESRDFSAMPILADALQDAGCDNANILTHCRDVSQIHVCGCWVVDRVLGKA